MRNKKEKTKFDQQNLPRLILVDFRRFSDFSALVLYCAFIFKARKTLDTAICSFDIVLYDRMIKKYMNIYLMAKI